MRREFSDILYRIINQNLGPEILVYIDVGFPWENIMSELFPLRYPATSDTEYWGGMLDSIWI